MLTAGADTTKENIQAWFNSGVSAVGIGSKLISKIMDAKDYQTIKNQLKSF